MKFLENYDCTINYHPKKINVVAYALSRKVQIAKLMIKEWQSLERICEWNPKIKHQKVICGKIMVRSTLLERSKEA